MRKEELDPAAETRPACTLSELAAKVRQMHKEHVRTTLEQARLIGVELQAAKRQCAEEGKSWLGWLEEAGINRVTAWKYIRIAENWTLLVDYVSLAKHGGVDGAIKHLAGGEGQEEEPGQKGPPKERLLCRACRVSGAPKYGCEDCAAMNAPEEPAEGPPDTTPGAVDQTRAPDREPGSDDGEIDQTQKAYPLKKVEYLGGVFRRECKALAETYGIAFKDEAGRLPVFEEPMIQRAYDKFAQANAEFQKAIRTLAKRAKLS
jgi:hypothetical protein